MALPGILSSWMGAEIQAVLKGTERLEGPWEDVPEGGGSAGTPRPTIDASPHRAVLQGGGGDAVRVGWETASVQQQVVALPHWPTR